MEDLTPVSARAAGISKAALSDLPVPKPITLSVALPTIGIALWCFWTAFTTTETLETAVSIVMSPEVAADAAEPPKAEVLASTPCIMVVPNNVLSDCGVAVEKTVIELSLCFEVTTVELPEVVATASEPPEVSVVSVAGGAWFSEVCSGRKTQETAVSKWVKCKMRNTCV